MKKIIFFIIFIVANLVIIAQTPKKWKDISAEDFNYKRSDTSVHAVILQESVSYYFDVWRDELRLFMDVQRRILILDEYGKKYEKLVIPYIGYDYFEEFVEFNEYTYSMENGKIKKYKMKNSAISTKKINKIDFEREVHFPEVKQGSIIEYKYTLASIEVVEPRKWVFQHEIPTLYSEFKANLPDFINYRINLIGGLSTNEIEKDKSIMVLNYIFRYTDPIPGGTYYRNRSFTTPVNFSFQTRVYTIKLKNIEPLENENFIDCECNYRKSVTMNLFRIDKKTGLVTNFENFVWEHLTKRMYQTTVENYKIMSKNESDFNTAPIGYIVFSLNDWETVDGRLNKNQNFGLQLIKAIAFKPVFNEIDDNFDDLSDFEKMIKIYDYVRLNFKWNGQYNIYSSDNLSEILTKKEGNSADLNLLLVSLFQKAELESFPVIVKTVDKGHFDEEFAYAGQFNNVLAGVKISGKIYLFDAIKKENRWFELDKNNLNGKGRIIKKIDSDFINISNNKESICKSDIKITIDENDKILYHIETTLTGYFIKEFRFDFYIQETQTSNLKTKNLVDTLKGERIFTTDFELNGKYENKTFLPLEVFRQFTPFLNSYRQMPVYFGYPFSYEYNVDIQVDESHKIKQYPTSFNKKINGAEFSLMSNLTENGVRISYKFSIQKQLFSTDEYTELRNFFFELEEYYGVQLYFY